MDKIAVLNGKEIAREKAINPKIGDKFNKEELHEFYNRVSKQLEFDNNSSEPEFYVRYWVTN